jgi:glycine hydroxymethyltransferase
MGEAEMRTIGALIAEVLDSKGDAAVIESVRGRVLDLCHRFPIY